MRIIISILVLFVVAQPIVVAVMESTNYSIQSDSVNFGGGLSDSPNYSLESTFGEVATGLGESANFSLKAGYQQMQEVYLAIGTIPNVTLSPAINGNIGGTSNGQAVVTVVTDNLAGYELYIKASSSPALVSGGDSFADYVPAGADPDFTFSIVATVAEFAFSPEGADITAEYLDNGVTCNAGALDTVDSCWRGLSTSNELIAESSTSNHPAGTDTTIKFRAESGASNIQPAGVYTATTTVTAISI
jgi:hypothetical protein